jgi:transposase
LVSVHTPTFLAVATGKVTDAVYERHGKAEFLAFMKQVAKAYPRRELHVVLDNYHTHKHSEVQAWLAKNPRITLHFAPTSGSWMNRPVTPVAPDPSPIRIAHHRGSL